MDIDLGAFSSGFFLVVFFFMLGFGLSALLNILREGGRVD